MNQRSMNNTNTLTSYNKVLLTIHIGNELIMPIIHTFFPFSSFVSMFNGVRIDPGLSWRANYIV